MAKGSYYDKASADFAVAFVEQLKHTKGKWWGEPLLKQVKICLICLLYLLTK